MKSEAWIFAACTVFFLLVTPAYWFMAADWTGTSALVMTTLLTAMIAGYLGFHAKQMDQPRPEDRADGEIADGAGELGFFPPYSWWPLWCALTAVPIVLGPVFGWWLSIMGAGFGIMALQGWIFEYYRGEHAH